MVAASGQSGSPPIAGETQPTEQSAVPARDHSCRVKRARAAKRRMLNSNTNRGGGGKRTTGRWSSPMKTDLTRGGPSQAIRRPPAIIARAFAAQTFNPVFQDDRRHQEGRRGIGPPPAEQCVQPNAKQRHCREEGTESRGPSCVCVLLLRAGIQEPRYWEAGRITRSATGGRAGTATIVTRWRSPATCSLRAQPPPDRYQ